MHPINRPYLTPSRLWDGRTVGLYGGSFNPAHGGHLHVSQRAIKRLKLDALWWLISPLNPLKKASDIAPLDARIEHAQGLVQHPKIHITAVETDLTARYSVQTIAHLRARFPRTAFIWLMGADSLANFHHWQDWQKIFAMLPIAVVDRPGYSFKALNSPAAQRFLRERLPERQSHLLKRLQPPMWTFLHGPLHSASATAIRVRQPKWAEKNGNAGS